MNNNNNILIKDTIRDKREEIIVSKFNNNYFLNYNEVSINPEERQITLRTSTKRFQNENVCQEIIPNLLNELCKDYKSIEKNGVIYKDPYDSKPYNDHDFWEKKELKTDIGMAYFDRYVDFDVNYTDFYSTEFINNSNFTLSNNFNSHGLSDTNIVCTATLTLEDLSTDEFQKAVSFISDNISYINFEDIEKLEKQGYLTPEQVVLRQTEAEKIEQERSYLEERIKTLRAEIVKLETELNSNDDFSPSFFQKFINKITDTFSKQNNNEPNNPTM